jgi:hypothetical protein
LDRISKGAGAGRVDLEFSSEMLMRN